jgi:CheY-like chemotaxis protein
MDSVLIVDDDPIALRVMTRTNEQAPYDGEVVNDPRAALTHCQTKCFPSLVTDQLDGLERYLPLKRQRPLLRGIVCSAHLDYHLVTSLIEAGFDDCLLKPVMPATLQHSVNRSLAIRFHWQDRIAQLRGLESKQ